MATALVYSRAQLGLSAPSVRVEVHLPTGLPGFNTTGISGTDFRDRVKSAIQNSSFDFPAGRIVVNLGPAELHKSGGRYDLAIAVGILIASEQLPAGSVAEFDLLGELSLFGDVQPVRGVLTAARESTATARTLLCPQGNGPEFAGRHELQVRLITHLDDLLRVAELAAPEPLPTPITSRNADPLGDIVGQQQAKRALTIAASGGHHMLMSGPPGAGKTMLAQRLRELLPRLPAAAASEVAEIYSLSGLTQPEHGEPPFRAPHHGASAAAVTGGGSPPTPGEITHAHHGVLFLDEMPEFRRDALEALREPLEGGSIRLSRRGYAVEYPARFQLVAAMNPCPAGLVCKPLNCRCAPDQAQRYRNRISAPVLDRIDLHINVQAVPMHLLLANRRPAAPAAEPLVTGNPSMVNRARRLQFQRSGCLNAHLDQQQTEAFCTCEAGVRALLADAAERLELSARGYYRALRVARTITDLDALADSIDSAGSLADEAQAATLCPPITESAVTEALGYRSLPVSGAN